MTRQRVDPEKRQRTAHACDSCKRRKQKCDGQQPCTACLRRRFDCEYSPSQPQQSSPVSEHAQPTESSCDYPTTFTNSGNNDQATQQQFYLPSSGSSMCDFTDLLQTTSNESSKTSDKSHCDGELGSSSIPNLVQMLKDTQGRMQYIGTSASPTLLGLVRMLAKTFTGPSQFTIDGEEQQLATERHFSIPANIDITGLTPSKPMALILVDSFFRNTTGTLEIFDEAAFVQKVHQVYQDISRADPSWLCHLYLVLAVGLCLATPLPGSHEAAAVSSLQQEHPNRSEEYYFAAKQLCNPQDGFEDADFWSIQALALMSWFMLCRSQKNRAYAYTGMAIRSAHALGLHQQDSLMHFNASEQYDRRNTWRTLFILDVFLAASLGRPSAMADTDLTSSILSPSTMPPSLLNRSPATHICRAAFEASIMTSHVTNQILQKVYASSKIDISVIQQIAVRCQEWPKNRAPFLSWRNASANDVRKSMGILHCNLSYCHSVMLLSRPSFLQVLMQAVREASAPDHQSSPTNGQTELKYASLCIEACAQSISIINTAFTMGYLPRMNPIASYHVFNSALVIFINELVRPASSDQADQWMTAAISMLDYCGQADPQAKESANTLRSLYDVINNRRGRSLTSPLSDYQHSHYMMSPSSRAYGSISQTMTPSLDSPLNHQSSPLPCSQVDVNLTNSPFYGPGPSTGPSLNSYLEPHLDCFVGPPAEAWPWDPVNMESMNPGGPVSMPP